MELNTQQKKQIIEQKIESYQAQVYSAKLDMSCADALEDEKWKERIRDSTKRLMQLIEVLDKELTELEDAV